MTCVEDLIAEEQLQYLQEIAEAREWVFRREQDHKFFLGIPANDGNWFYLFVEHENYPALPPAWHWCDETGANLDQKAYAPNGAGFLHSSGRICAPWNRLAYKEVDPDGPHGDWKLENWATNPKNGQCQTLTAMALRIHVELHGQHYKGGYLA